MTHDAHLCTPTGRPRATGLGIPFSGTPGEYNAITDVPGVEVALPHERVRELPVARGVSA